MTKIFIQALEILKSQKYFSSSFLPFTPLTCKNSMRFHGISLTFGNIVYTDMGYQVLLQLVSLHSIFMLYSVNI